LNALLPGRYACVHVGASTPSRRWPLDRFVEVARHLVARGLSVVVTGTRDEVELTRAVARDVPGHVVDVAGRTDLGMLGVLFQRARLLVSNDTGVSHLADALRLPSVVISTGDNPCRWAPRDRALHRVLCRPWVVTTGEVVAQVEDLLGSSIDERGPVPAHPGPSVAFGGTPGLHFTAEALRP
jgi:ADP-heptose:LPS heptosyltransferase